MADGEIRVKLDDATVQRLENVAEAAGQSVDEFVRNLIANRLDDDWSEDLAALEEYDRTGVSYSVEEAMTHFRDALHEHVRKKAR